MAEMIVLAHGQRRDIALDSATYTIRALTHAEHARLQAEMAAHRAPSSELINATLCELATERGEPELAEAILAEDEAVDALQALLAEAPPALDDVGQARWRAENAAELARLRKAVLAAGRRARLARERFAGDPALDVLTRQAAEALAAASQLTVAAGVAAIDGKPVVLSAEDAAHLPSSHVTRLAQEISALLAPSRDAAKN